MTIIMRNEIKACLIDSMERELDGYMAEHGFKRANGSLIYKRRVGEATQIIDCQLQIHPKDNRNAAAAVYPRIEILIPSVDRVLKDMVGDNLGLLEGITGGTSRQPIGWTSVKENPGRWYLYQSDSVPPVVQEMREFIERWTMPFLDVYSTPQDVVATEQRADPRLSGDRAQKIRVVAAALVCNKPEYAANLMEKWFSAMLLRRRYQQVFAYVQRTKHAAT